MKPPHARFGIWLYLLASLLPPHAIAEVDPPLSFTATLGRTHTLGTLNYWYEGGVATSTSLLTAVSRHISIGAEVGYQGIGTAFTGFQCGEEWGIDCPGPRPRRIGLWSLSALARLRGGAYRAHPYIVGGVGAYLTPNPVVYSGGRTAIERHVQPGATAGVGIYGFLPGGVGVEGRWHGVLTSRPGQTYKPINYMTAQVAVHIP